MRFKIASLLAVAFSLGVAQAASAADMPAKAPIVKAPVAVPFSWAGWYVGLNGGYIWGRSTEHDNYNGPPDISYKQSGFQGGAHFGYNWQINQFVLGVEGEVGYLAWKKSQQYGPFIGVRTPADSVANTSNGAFAVLAGRVGFALNNTLLFAKAGGIFTGVKNSFTDTDPQGVVIVSGTDTKNRNGWTVGGGLEYAFTKNWAARLEYAHYAFGTASHTPVDSLGNTYLVSHTLSADSVRGGVTYLFH